MSSRKRSRRKGTQATPAADPGLTSNNSRRLLIVAVAALVTVALAGFAYFWLKQPAGKAEAPPPAQFIAGADLGYVDPVACAGCHAEIQETYRLTGMGRSFYRSTPESMAGAFKPGNSYHHEPSDRHYTMIERQGEYYIRRHQVGPGGSEINVLEKRIAYVIGSGNHSRSYLWRTADGGLAQFPVSWYAENGGYWAMSPGYDRPDHQGFLREAASDCIACHNAYPTIEQGTDLAGGGLTYPADMPEGIDCQRCHGPGREHIAVFENSDPSPEAIRASIVNPARLDAERQIEVCMQCHLETTVEGLPHAMRRNGRGAFSYQPGQPLGEFTTHFDYAPDAGPDDLFEIAHAAYRLRKSACFRQSNGALTCTTCHNPHDVRRGAEAAKQYIATCRSCHDADFEALVSIGKHTSDGDCLDCHMPKRRTDDVVHVVMTDHYIRRRQPARDLLAAKAEVHHKPYQGRVVPYYPPDPAQTPENELLIAVAQVKSGSNLDRGIPELEQAIAKHSPNGAHYHYELAEAYTQAGRTDDAVSTYQEALRQDPKHLLSLEGFGRLLARSGRAEQAVPILEQALEQSPNAYQTRGDLGLAYLKLGQLPSAIKELQTAVRLNPDAAQSQSGLGAALVQTRDLRAAEAAFRQAIQLKPDYANAHTNLANLLAGTNKPSEAEYHFQQALKFDADSLEAHYNYGRLLAALDRYSDAESQLRSALKLDSKVAEIHDELGTLFAMQGKNQQAIAAYRQAIEARPGYALAAFNLGAILLREGQNEEAKRYFEQALASEPDFAEAHLNLGNQYAVEGKYQLAESHFRKAAASTDPALRQAAQDSLTRLPSVRTTQ
ncbi:MAG: tetratricopeptide repeat protein [Acidobacteria bacterium]|nr:tetratricopeptide repeat protein [Acidobacteriota bacterium]